MSKVEIKVAKAQNKEALKNKPRYIAKRDELVYQMLNSPAPNWGGIKINLVKY